MNALVAAVLVSTVLAQAPKAEAPKGPKMTFFPAGAISDFEQDWYGKALSRMEEPSLADAAKDAKVYRFTLLPTWGNPVAVRLTIKDGKGTIDAKRLDGQGGYDPGKLAEKGSVTLSPSQVQVFQALFGKVGFGTEDTDGVDGSQWILEAAEAGKYRIAVRWTPRHDTAKRGLTDFVAVCEWLYRASPLKADTTNKGDVEIQKSPKAKKAP